MSNATLDRRRKELLWDLERSARYHAKRRAFFDGWQRWITFVIIFSSTFVFGSLVQDWAEFWIERLAALVPAILGTLALVFDLSNKARDHEFLFRRFTLLHAEVTGAAPQSEAELQRFEERMGEIYADEPPVYRVVNAEAYNEIIDAHGLPRSAKTPIGWHGLLKHYIRFENFDVNRGAETG